MKGSDEGSDSMEAALSPTSQLRLGTPKPVSVLVVDDNEDDRVVVRRFLQRDRRYKFEIREASSVETALAAIAVERPDVLITDQHMGRFAGTQMLEKLRDVELGDCAILLITGSAGDVDLDRIFEAGADDYVRKEEINEAMFLRVVSNAMAKARLRASLRAARRRLEEQLAFEEQLIGMVSHDLRTPLSSLLLATQTLTDEVMTEDGRSVLGILVRSGQRIRNMVTQLLDLTRVRRAATFPVNRKQTDVGAVVSQVVEELGSTHEDRSIELKVEGVVTAWVDASAFGQVTSNLVTNALRYGDQSPIVVRLRRDGDQVEIAVRNGGEKIPEETLKRLFEPFVRAATGHGGLGLGLFIVRAIVEAHQGEFAAESTEESTTFRVRLPRRIG